MNKKKAEEKVLCVKADDVFDDGEWDGISADIVDKVLKLSVEKGEYRKRGEVEEDPSWQQIIPYIIFRHGEEIFVMQRSEKAGEQRLASLYSVGIGGHLRKEDLDEGNDVIDWSKREFGEEVDYSGDVKFKVVGVLNDNSAPVHSVHLGVVIVAQGDSPDISVRSEHRKGELMTLSSAKDHLEQMEKWSKIVLDFLEN